MSWLGDNGHPTFVTTHVYTEALATCGSGGNDEARSLSEEKRDMCPASSASPDTPWLVVLFPGGVVGCYLSQECASRRASVGRLAAVRRIGDEVRSSG